MQYCTVLKCLPPFWPVPPRTYSISPSAEKPLQKRGAGTAPRAIPVKSVHSVVLGSKTNRSWRGSAHRIARDAVSNSSHALGVIKSCAHYYAHV